MLYNRVMKRKRYIYMLDGGPGRQYIGQTVDLKKRLGAHRSEVKRGGDNALYRAVNKHGWDAFPLRTLAYGWWTDEQADAAESGYIAYHDTFHNGLNETRGGGGVTGRECRQETRDKIASKKRNCKASAETRKKQSIAHSGKTLSDEHCRNIGDAHRGMKRSEQACKNMRDAQLRPETVAKKVAANRGKPKLGLRGHKQSQEHVAKRMESRRLSSYNNCRTMRLF